MELRYTLEAHSPESGEGLDSSSGKQVWLHGGRGRGRSRRGELAKVSGWGSCADQGTLITVGETGKAWAKLVWGMQNLGCLENHPGRDDSSYRRCQGGDGGFCELDLVNIMLFW